MADALDVELLKKTPEPTLLGHPRGLFVLFTSEMCTVSSVFRTPMNFFSGTPIFAEERQKPKPEHVKRS